MSEPDSNTSPASDADGISSCIRLRIRRKVDFPQPDGPINAVTDPAGIYSDTRSSTLRSPNHAETDRASNAANSAGGEVGGGGAGAAAACGDTAGIIVVGTSGIMASGLLDSGSVTAGSAAGRRSRRPPSGRA